MKAANIILALAFMLSTNLLLAQKTEVNTQSSTIEWTGKKIGGSHTGNIQLQSGTFTIQNNQIVSGKFVMDMKSITNSDIDDPETRQKLIGHLKSDDFFGAKRYPTAIFEVKQSTPFKNGTATVEGIITIKGTSEPIRFEVVRSGNSYATTLEIDRAKFDVRYGSDSFFDNLGNKAIDDIFTLDIKLIAR
ncbi:MAG: YceI family protein [Bacteroidales bacterium]